MKDPHPSLLDTLNTLFTLQPKRNGAFSYNEVHTLKKTCDLYTQAPSKNNFMLLQKSLLRALSIRALDYLQEQKLFEHLKKSLDRERQYYGLSAIDWSQLSFYSSPQFQFSALNHSEKNNDLVQWLTRNKNKSYEQLSIIEQIQLLIENKEERGFKTRLKEYLTKDANFLFNFIVHSTECFKQITHSVLILYLTDEQLATAIINHLPTEPIALNEIKVQINKINETLSYGRSISTLLRCANAKKILDTLPLFQLYQSKDYEQGAIFSDTQQHQEVEQFTYDTPY